MPFVYLPEVNSVMVRISKAPNTSIIRSGFNTDHSFYFESCTRESATRIYAEDLSAFEYRFEDQFQKAV